MGHSFPFSANIIIIDAIAPLQLYGVERGKFTFTISTDDYY